MSSFNNDNDSNSNIIVNNNEKSNLYSKDLIRKLDFYDYNSLINLIELYDLYYRSKDNENLRIKILKFFVTYHRLKFVHYIDIKGYIKWVVEIFYDESKEIYGYLYQSEMPVITYSDSIDEKWMQLIYTINSFYPQILYDIKHEIINDKRFKSWFTHLNETDKDQLKSRLHLEYIGHNESIYRNTLYMLGYKDRPIKFDYEYLVDYVYNNNNNNNNNNSNNNNKVIKSTINQITIISDLVVEKIISDTLSIVDCKYLFNKEDTGAMKILSNRHILDLAVVSKQFFRVISKIINNYSFYWNSYININRDEFNLISAPPLYFDYESINEYRGLNSNYSHLLRHIIMNTPNGNGHGIENLSLSLANEREYGLVYHEFFTPLLQYHSDTLKSVRIDIIHFNIYDERLMARLDKLSHTFENKGINFRVFTMLN
ncbi:hypothetical protein PPL_01845 [Heterostelium album PN500]|uniref:Uncharacterized protein n=1 Tax=Heterostelium pallidum (strain ATCC 26659 / Pp 5 / PN500) TaxID=670386 RepID=D3B0M8_HETP5|nr:hypothetical protein PPL_01845 [Heterostelium album PN500]EFA84852.1 hypothetical protein PPL_01845 [Heterostelium album PN500]|eukprot:XP_020436963.1 hypothetical protein PPL_01845 [Heterostelium album PN500]